MKKLNTITLITGNSHKANTIKKYLNFPLDHQKVDLVEIQSLNLPEVLSFKAKEAYSKIHKPVLVEDTSLTFHALGKLPGTYIKWFWEQLGDEKLCRLLDPFENKSAHVEVALGLYDGEHLEIFSEVMKGKIAAHPKGNYGFGWNPIFIPEGFNRTWAEFTEAEKGKYSARVNAVKKLGEYLRTQL